MPVAALETLVMPYKAKVFEVMIASPVDVPAERATIREVIHDWNTVHSEKEGVVLLPVGWESHSSPSMGDRPQAIINKQVLEDCDLLIAVFWTRLGSPTGKSRSGTVEEIERHLKAGKPAMIYFSSIPFMLESTDQEQYQALVRFKEELRSKGLLESYTSQLEFRDKLTRQLAQTVIRSFLPKKKDNRHNGKGDDDLPHRRFRIPSLSTEARQLLAEACQDPNAMLVRIGALTGLTIQTNGREFVEPHNPRMAARWQAALQELLKNELMRDRGVNGEIFGVTEEGYRVAGLLRVNPGELLPRQPVTVA